jgi:hypothetical protein
VLAVVRNFPFSLGFSDQNNHTYGARPMPILLWLLGVPLTLVIVLMLAGVV